MNAEKLAQYVYWLTRDETTFDIQDRLSALNLALRNLVANPQAPQYQTEVAENLGLLETEVENCRATYDEVQWNGVATIGAGQFFSEDMVDQIKARISGNSMTPSVAQVYVQAVLNEREVYLGSINNLKAGLDAVGIRPISNDQPEIGFQIPRSIFNNNLEGLTKELRTIRRIIDAFAEIISGSADEIEVRQISSTDPTFYFGIPAATIAAIGYAVSWSLDQWKKVEDIRKVRADVRRLPVFTAEDIDKLFDTKIKELVSAAVEERVSELIGPSGSTGRKAEQRKLLAWTLEALLARIERGLVVEIRLPPAPDAVEGSEEAPVETESEQMTELRKLKSELTFPKIEGNPVLSLPEYKDEGSAKKTVATKKDAEA